ncbi:hypothetical protein D3C86_939350 [compost metagenome]
MSAKWLLSGGIALSLASTFVASPAIAAAESPAQHPLVTDLLHYAQAADKIIPALPEEISKVDPTLLRIFLFNERRRPETDKLDLLVENRLHELLLPMRRFKVLESRESKVRKVVSTPTELQVSTTIESLDRLRDLAGNVGADGVLMYAPFVTNDVVMVHLKLVRASDGEIVWTHRYSYDFNADRQGAAMRVQAAEDARKAEEAKRAELDRKTRDNGVYLYTGVTGLSAERASTNASVPGRRADLSLSVGVMALRNTYFWENLAVGLDAEYLQAGGVDTSLYHGFVNLTPLLFLRLDPLFVGKENLGIVNLYAGPGIAFSLSDALRQPATAKGGLLLRFTPDLFMNLGLTYVPQQSVSLSDAGSGFANSMTYGGMSYHATIGMSFR